MSILINVSINYNLRLPVFCLKFRTNSSIN